MTLTSLIITEDKQQAIRIRRFLMSIVAYLLTEGVALLMYRFGYLDASAMRWSVLMMISVPCALYVCFRSGLNLRMPDPSLTVVQMMVAIMVILFHAYVTTHVRGEIVAVFLVVFLFGAYQLRTRQLLQLALFVMAAYGCVIYMLYQQHPGLIDMRVEMLQWVTLALLLPCFAMVGGNISSLREKLRDSHGELKRAMEQIQEMAIHDELTGLYNRRHFMGMLGTVATRANCNGQLFCVLMLDVDHFKTVNDRQGHLAGDQVLRSVADAVRIELRGFDFCGRFGGEEFILVVGQSTLDGALLCAERIRTSVADLAFPGLPDDFRITISVGVSEFELGEEIENTIGRADAALYRAKGLGRNCVVRS
ncbi:MAG: GGDEF domain-containing protein [Burkholderiaceae bacterium]|nr:GGDEF domain-containing protein [Burkholderiaceae bacterium]